MFLQCILCFGPGGSLLLCTFINVLGHVLFNSLAILCLLRRDWNSFASTTVTFQFLWICCFCHLNYSCDSSLFPRLKNISCSVPPQFFVSSIACYYVVLKQLEIRTFWGEKIGITFWSGVFSFDYKCALIAVINWGHYCIAFFFPSEAAITFL